MEGVVDKMERYAWKAKVKEGRMEQYIERHNNIFPELKEVLKQAGICNYTIFASENNLFGYYECEKGADFAQKVQNGSEVVAKWDEYMSDILIWDDENTQPRMTEVFRLD